MRVALGCVSAACMLHGCGRLGIELLPLDGEPHDASTECELGPQNASFCGGCEGPCVNQHGTTACVDGVCRPACSDGFADCDGDPSNGCETHVTADPRHCGTCSHACALDAEICQQGACAASPCAPGLAECDGDPGISCETNLETSLEHCGFCGNACEVQNGGSACVERLCAIAFCLPGYADCDDSAVTGCETQLTSSTLHCGACSTPCTNEHGTTRCVDSRCVPTCSAGFGDCDQDPRNGCETALDSVNHCGMCGRACPANGGTPVCNTGECTTRCDLNGTYALKMTLQGTWPDTQNIARGSGTFSFWMLFTGTQSGTQLVGTLRECGRFIPPFRASPVNETLLFGYPSAWFDRTPPVLPSVPVSISLSNASPGASLSLPPSAVQIGVNMANPVNDPWPALASGIPVAQRVDMDADGQPGVTALYSNAGDYVHPRTSALLFGFNRAENPYVASRVAFSLSGSLTDCTTASGAANFNYVDTRIFGCKLSGSSQECSASEADFLDRNCLNYNLGAADFNLIKIAPNATCAQVRAALP